MVSIDLVVQSHPEGSWTVVDVEGEVDVFTAPKLREHLVELIGSGAYRLIVNLEKVAFMDSTGLGTLIGSLKRVKEHDGVLTLVCTNRSVLRVLSITGLDKVLPVHDSVQSALRAG